MARELPAPLLLDANTSAYPLARARSAAAASEDFAVALAAVVSLYGVHARVSVFCGGGGGGGGGGAADAAPPVSAAEAAARATAQAAAIAAERAAAEEAKAKIGDGGAEAAAARPPPRLVCRSPAALANDEACKPAADAARLAVRPPRHCRSVVEARLGKSAKKLNGWVAQHRRGQRALGKTVKGAKTLWYRRDAQGYLWLPLTYQLAAAEQVPGAPYPPNATLVVHYPLPLAGSGGTAAAAGRGGRGGRRVEPRPREHGQPRPPRPQRRRRDPLRPLDDVTTSRAAGGAAGGAPAGLVSALAVPFVGMDRTEKKPVIRFSPLSFSLCTRARDHRAAAVGAAVARFLVHYYTDA